mmetsp:Transcript_65103/g.160281  ORF Transcript_65103/g.160281 Transcript_65103/m.160281 type:complete len:108 (+) Transcript_65103:187-510(+)
MRSKFNILCPAAQLLISDRPANSDLASRLGRKERARSLSNSTATEEGEGGGRAAVRQGGLSMVLPNSVLHAHSLMGEVPYDEAGLVEVRCDAYDLRPLTAQPGLVPT